MPDTFYTVHAAAKQLGVSRSMVERAVDDKTLAPTAWLNAHGDLRWDTGTPLFSMEALVAYRDRLGPVATVPAASPKRVAPVGRDQWVEERLIVKQSQTNGWVNQEPAKTPIQLYYESKGLPVPKEYA